MTSIILTPAQLIEKAAEVIELYLEDYAPTLELFKMQENFDEYMKDCSEQYDNWEDFSEDEKYEIAQESLDEDWSYSNEGCKARERVYDEELPMDWEETVSEVDSYNANEAVEILRNMIMEKTKKAMGHDFVPETEGSNIVVPTEAQILKIISN